MYHLNDCFKITRTIVNSYNMLEYLAVNSGVDSLVFKEMVSKIRGLVTKEYYMYHSLNLDTIFKGLEQFNDPGMILDTYLYRINNQLNTVLELNEEIGFSYEDFVLEKPLTKCNFNFILSEIICTILELEMLRIMDKVADGILKSNEFSLEYKDEFKKIHYNYLIYYFTIRNTSEIIGLNYNFDINKCPKITIEGLIDNLSVKYGADIISSLEEFKNGFVEMAMATLNNLLSLLNDNDSVEKDYQYLFYITALEVYINKLDNDRVKVLYDYINNLNIEDNKTRTILRKILKQKK